MNEENEIEFNIEIKDGDSFCPVCGYFIEKIVKESSSFDCLCPKCEKTSFDNFIDYGSETHRIYWTEFVETGLLFYGAWIPPPSN